MQRVTGMVEQGLLNGQRLILASTAAGSPKADIEDLFTDGDYLELYNKAFSKSVKVADLPAADRIVKRLEAKEGEFVHGEVAEVLLRHHHELTFTDTNLDRFSKLFDIINETMQV